MPSPPIRPAFRLVHAGVHEILRIEPGPWRLADFTMLDYVEAGRFRLELADGEIITAGAGRTTVMPPGIRCRVLPPGRKTVVSCACLAYPPLPPAAIAASLGPPAVLPPSTNDLVGTCVKALCALRGEKGEWSLARLARLQRLGFELLEALVSGRDREPRTWPDWSRFQPVIDHVNENIHRPISREVLARLMHLSPTRFHYVFKEVFGQAPMAYVRSARVLRAQELLLASGDTLQEIARQCGFKNPYHFGRFFKKYTGTSPGSYRKSLR